MLPWEKRQTYPALYGPGFVEISINDIGTAFTSKIDTPARRRITSNLRNFIGVLSNLGVKGEIWINGSFSTMNPHPHDFDVLLVIPKVTLSGMTDENKKKLWDLTDESQKEYVRRRWSCDLYVCDQSNLGVRRIFESKFSKNPEIGGKGIPVIKLS